jgi:hypothetical protein
LELLFCNRFGRLWLDSRPQSAFVLRGGAWNNNDPTNLRCGRRNNNHNTGCRLSRVASALTIAKSESAGCEFGGLRTTEAKDGVSFPARRAQVGIQCCLLLAASQKTMNRPSK